MPKEYSIVESTQPLESKYTYHEPLSFDEDIRTLPPRTKILFFLGEGEGDEEVVPLLYWFATSTPKKRVDSIDRNWFPKIVAKSRIDHHRGFERELGEDQSD